MPFKALFFCLPMLFASTVMAQDAAEKPAPMRSPAASVPAEPDNVLDLEISDGGRVGIQLHPDLPPNHVEGIQSLARRGCQARQCVVYGRRETGRVGDGGCASTNR